MFPLYSITKVCGSLPGLTAIIFSDMTNVEGYGPASLPPAPNTPITFIENDKVYSIAFEKQSAELTKVSQEGGQIGSWEQITATCFIPRSRNDVEVLLRRMNGRLMLIIGINRYGNQHILANAQRSYSHTTGAKPGNRHGYQVTWTAPGDYIRPSIAGNGDVDSAPAEPGGGGGEGMEGDCSLQ